MYFRGHRTHNRKLQNNEDRKSCYKIFLHHNSNAVYFDACHTFPWDIPLQTFFLLSIESWVHMCVRRIFFVEQLNIGKTEGGGLIWSKLTLFRHPIILEETVFFCAKRHIFTKPFFLFQLWRSYRVQSENFSHCIVTSIYLRRDESETKTKIRENEFHEFFFREHF